MSHIIDLDIWYTQWQTLDNTPDAMIQRFKNLAQEEPVAPRLSTLRWLAEALREFGKSQFCFFYEGFRNNLEERKTGESLGPMNGRIDVNTDSTCG